MLKIHHRTNDIESLKRVSEKDGVEVDIHAYRNSLNIHHDAFAEGQDLEDWIKFYNHRFLILNIKEEGIEDRVLKVMKKNRIEDFFMLDLSFPSLMKLVKKGEKRVAIRVSDYESIHNALLLKGKVNWVWIDMFDKKFPISRESCELLRKSGFRLCLASPELHYENGEETSILLKNFIDNNRILIQAVCTANVKIWQK